MMVLLLLIIFAIIVWIEVPSLIRNKMWGELIAFSVLMTIGIVLSIAQTIGFKLPNPTKGLETIFKPLSNLIKS